MKTEEDAAPGRQDARYVVFLQWALPRLGLRWPGFRKVRRQVIKRIARRLQALQLADLDHYRVYLQSHEQEWRMLDRFCRITISRFCRDRAAFEPLAREGLPQLISLCRSRDENCLRCWSAGCGAGEEGYTLALVWAFAGAPRVGDTGLSILATDIDPAQIARAEHGCYPPSSLRELPPLWRETAFTEKNGRYCIRAEYRRPIRFAVQDLREGAPDGPFHLVLCRNLAFTYFSGALQEAAARRIGAVLAPGGMLMIGSHESLPGTADEFDPWRPPLPIYRKRS
jgi:chemotaxis protein methyltransferase CheR